MKHPLLVADAFPAAGVATVTAPYDGAPIAEVEHVGSCHGGHTPCYIACTRVPCRAGSTPSGTSENSKKRENMQRLLMVSLLLLAGPAAAAAQEVSGKVRARTDALDLPPDLTRPLPCDA
jgi:hypothetical protein